MYKFACFIALIIFFSENIWASESTAYKKVPQNFEKSLSKATDLDSFVYRDRQDDFEKGLKAIAEGRYIKAERMLRLELRDRPACAMASINKMQRYCRETAIRSYYLGFALIGQSRFNEAVPYLKEANLLDPRTPEFIGALALAYRNNGDIEKADALTKKLNDDLKLSHQVAQKNRIIQAISDSQLELRK